MRKTIKSGSEINKEINAIFENYKSDAELLERMDNYINNLTGKELYTKKKIENMIAVEMFERVLDGKIKFERKSPVYSKNPGYKNLDAVRFKEDLRHIGKKSNYFYKYMHAVLFLSKLHHFSVLGNFESYHEYYDTYEYFTDYGKENPAFGKLKKLLFENKDVAVMLFNHADEIVYKFLGYLLKRDMADIRSLLMFFDQEKTVKENINMLHELSERSVPRNSIQKVIHDNLDAIREGKFTSPLFKILSEENPYLK